MKARIVKDGSFWIGEVYGHWNMMFGLYKRVGWGTVTSRCYTQFLAKCELKKWKTEHCADEFEI